MKTVQRPYWLFLSVTLPQMILFTIFFRIHQIIGSLLAKQSEAAWIGFGLGLAALCLGFTAYAIFAFIRRQALHPLTGVAILASYVPWLYLVATNLEKIIPWDTPRWMLFWVAPEIFLFTMVVPALVFAIILLVAVFTPEPDRYKPAKDIILTVGIPAAWYLAFNLFLAIIRFGPVGSKLMEHAVPIAMILSTLVFLLVLGRLAYAFLRRSQGLLRVILIPVVLILPVVGLAINQTMGGVFGDFSSPVYYFLAVVTGILVVMPMPRENRARLALFVAKSIVFPFTGYFFLVFLPFVPLAIPVILMAGVGFLILSPTILGIKHVLSLRDDFVALRTTYGKTSLLVLFFVGCLAIPGTYCLMAWNDSRQIQSALDYLYRTGYSMDSGIRVSRASLARVIKNIEANKSDDGQIGVGMGERTPYLTSLYNWIVLDNLTIAEGRIQDIKRVFWDEQSRLTALPAARGRRISTSRRQSTVIIKSIKTTTETDSKNESFHSRIDLVLLNDSPVGPAEFASAIEIPPGCYVTGYDLVVNGRRKKGILADKRAATWVYQQIVNERKDPGILVYGEGNTLVLRVFPFEAQETRLTGIELIHQTPVTLTIGEKQVKLGGPEAAMTEVKTAAGAVLVPVSVKKTLPTVSRKPVYHFILDFSGVSKKRTVAYVKRVNSYMEKQGIKPAEATFTAVNYKLTTIRGKSNWAETIGKVHPTGGFYLDRAVKAFLVQHYRDNNGSFPVIVVATDIADHCHLYDDYHVWRPAFPETDAYYRLADNGDLFAHSLLTGETDEETNPVIKPSSHAVAVWPNTERPVAYLPIDGEDSLVVTNSTFQTRPEGRNGTQWEEGLTLEAMSLALAMDPGSYRERETAIIRRSLQSGVMARPTSFIVLENAAQEAAMRAKQKQILSSEKVVDASETDNLSTEPEMAEPSLILILVLALVLIGGKWYFRKKLRLLGLSKPNQIF